MGAKQHELLEKELLAQDLEEKQNPLEVLENPSLYEPLKKKTNKKELLDRLFKIQEEIMLRAKKIGIK
jgi:hypothetical protein